MSLMGSALEAVSRPGMATSSLRGILYMVLGVFAFSIQDLIIKKISAAYAVHEIVFVRSFTAVLVILLIARIDTGGWRLQASNLWLHLARAAVMFAAYTFYYLGLASLPLAEAAVISYAAPFFIAALALVFLGERVSPLQWAAIAIGFLGVMVVMRPGSELFNAAALLPLSAALFYSIAQMLARYLGRTDSGSSLAFYLIVPFVLFSGVLGLALALLDLPQSGNPSYDFLVRPWVWPTPRDLALMLLCGLVASLGIYCLSQAYRLAPAALAASFEYSAIPWIVLWGVLFFSEWPSWATAAGVALVVGSGLFILWRGRAIAH